MTHDIKNLEKRASVEWSRLAGEAVNVEDIKGVMYAFGSEMATFRLLRAFRWSDKADCGFSAVRQSHYFRLEREYTLST